MLKISKSHLLLFFTIAFFSNITLGQTLPSEVLLNKTMLLEAKQKITAGDATYSKAYDVLIKMANKALSKGPYSVVNKTKLPPSGDKHDYVSLAPYYWPNPDTKDGLPYIRKDGKRNPEVEDYQDRLYMPQMIEEVEALSLAYFYSDDEKYASHAAKLVKTWFLEKETMMNPNLNFAQAIKGQNEGRGAGLIESRHFIEVIESVKLLNGSSSWSDNDNKMLKKWFADFLNWMQTSPNGIDEFDTPNNHGTWYDVQRLSYALYLDDLELAKNIANNATSRLDKQMDNFGSFPKELERTIALHYSTFNLHAFFVIAEMAEGIGVDLWNIQTPSSKSLKKGFDFIYPYLTKEKEWKGQQIKPFDFGEGAPILIKAAAKFNCDKCIKAIDKLGLKEENRLILLLTTEYKE
ncbi:MAG: alginate lyase family protein [Tenuifilaceae bacterium]